MERIVATIFIVGFFSFLPLWGLSKQRGWVSLIGKREGPTGPFAVTVVRRNAFSTSRELLEVTGAHARLVPRSVGRRSSGDWLVFVLEMPDRRNYEVMDDLATSILFVPSVMEPIKTRADLINTARDTGQTSFTIDIPPDGTFWLLLGITVVFAGVGLVVALVGGGSAALEPQ